MSPAPSTWCIEPIKSGLRMQEYKDGMEKIGGILKNKAATNFVVVRALPTTPVHKHVLCVLSAWCLLPVSVCPCVCVLSVTVR